LNAKTMIAAFLFVRQI